ncbi:hypothetical protein HanRHA438_Chr02g0087431 [Helianthus annuus]|uniref:Uncharacterized protein n=1 Tax=Helianthus annuus TaxID=4232 RepID=A0A251VJ07_HELAN|nr:hypothetical protein HanXRQr2_Chr02g0076101 [Helianthus annuus]KAJ0514954.1 hypothetical protein HanHA300_Chr10g0375341 [Helianthus annuus]KAJ0619483.1 hypothetical protein HanHA89_Chr02g0071861 [Helianthus annuus]KAJ0701336.1 hypothetical protein HanOQP8_Chr10g0378281 [Helianthus annuus]KAJ0940794.1 hypothetical protein HanRHA438_Chr02g0087431 [Helianthus annuus]
MENLDVPYRIFFNNRCTILRNVVEDIKDNSFWWVKKRSKMAGLNKENWSKFELDNVCKYIIHVCSFKLQLYRFSMPSSKILGLGNDDKFWRWMFRLHK